MEQVICIDDRPSGYVAFPGVRGAIYTVTSECPNNGRHRVAGKDCPDAIGIFLAEIQWPPEVGSKDDCRCFDSLRFRPVKRTDIGALREITKRKPDFKCTTWEEERYAALQEENSRRLSRVFTRITKES